MGIGGSMGEDRSNEDKRCVAALIMRVVVVYLPVFCGAHYLFHDDWATFAWNKATQPFDGRPMATYLVTLGRPIGAALLVLFHYPIEHIADGNWARLFLVLLLSVLTAQLFLAFRLITRDHGHDDPIVDAAAAFGVAMLPTFTTYVACISNGIAFAACNFAILAGHRAARAIAPARPARPGRRAARAASMLAMLTAALTYQTGALLFFLPLALQVALARREDILHTAAFAMKIALPGLIALGLYAAYFMLAATPEVYAGPTGLVQLTSAPLWLFQWALPATLNLWSVYPVTVVTQVVAATIIVALVLLDWRDRGRLHAGTVPVMTAVRLIVLIGSALVMSAPVILSGFVTRPFYYRANPGFVALAAFVLIYNLARALREFFGFPRAARLSALAIAAVAAVLANFNANQLIVGPTSAELAFIGDAISHANLREIRQIHLIIPNGEPGLSFIDWPSVNDEFADPVTYFPQDVLPMMVAVLRDFGVSTHGYRNLDSFLELPNGLRVSRGTRAETVQREIAQPALIIDMTILDRHRPGRVDGRQPSGSPPASVPPDSVPPDSVPPDSVPPDSVPPDKGPWGYLVEEGFKGFNILQVGPDRFLGLSQSEGIYFPEKLAAGAYKKAYLGATIADVKAQISSADIFQATLVQEGFNGFNILQIGPDRFLALGQSEGIYFPEKLAAGGYMQAYIGSSIEDV